MSETEDPRQAFEQYLKEQEGKSIDPRAVAAANMEMELGAKSDFAVVKDEADRETRIKSYPKGHEFKTEMSEDELKEGIDALTLSYKVIVWNIEHPSGGLLDKPEDVSLYDLEKHEKELPEDFREAFQTVVSWIDPEGEMTLFDLPEEIKETIVNYKKVLAGMQEK
jgi:hypothetical protein